MAVKTKARIPLGSRVKKVSTHRGDRTPIGTIGEVTGYLGVSNHPVSKKTFHGYMVKWEGQDRGLVVYDDGRLSVLGDSN